MTARSKWFFHTFLLSTLVTLSLSITYYLKQAENFPITAVEIHGEFAKTLPTDIKNALNQEVLRGFFSVDLNAVRSLLLQLPWVATVSVKRVWPDRLSVHLYEHSALACYEHKAAISTEGVVFHPRELKLLAHLPLFKGPENRVAELVEHYQLACDLLEATPLAIAEFSLAASGHWQLRFTNDLQLMIGRSAFEERLRRFVKVYLKSLQPHVELMNYVDLRYTNGLSLGWKPGILKPLLGVPIR